MASIRLTHAAATDLEEIWLYIARDSIDTADRFLDFLTTKFPLLADSPRIGRLREDLAPGLRFFPVKNYIIYYRAVDKNTVAIIRVVNAARHQESLFAEE